MDTPMCSTCSIETNREAWANYPHMLDLCKMCKSFQLAIQHTIEEAESMQKRLEK